MLEAREAVQRGDRGKEDRLFCFLNIVTALGSSVQLSPVFVECHGGCR